VLEDLYSRTSQVRLPEASICCLRQGSGPHVMLLHGIPLSLLTWRNNVEALARQHTVVAPDLKGYGRSQKPPGDYSPEAHARVLGGLLDAFGIRSTTLVASSYSCAPAIRLALDDGQRVDRLVLINSIGHPGGRHSLERLLRIRGVAAMLRLALRRRRVGRALFMSRLKQSYANPAALPKEVADAYFDLFLRNHGEETFLRTLLQFDETAVVKALPRVTQPTLIIWGERDRILPVANALCIQQQIPGAQLRILPDVGHLSHEEAAADVNRLIIDFLAAAPAGNHLSG
jgi:pimeloyl-ACP methyl ester carboxylesterase